MGNVKCNFNNKDWNSYNAQIIVYIRMDVYKIYYELQGQADTAAW